MGFRPKGVKADWKDNNTSLYRLGLDKGAGFASGAKGGLRSNKLMIDAEGALLTAQEAQFKQILDIISDKKTINLLNEYKNPDKWLKSSKYRTELQNKLYPAKKIGELAIMGVSKSKMEKMIHERAAMDKADIQQYARQLMMAREVNLAAFYKKQAAEFRKAVPGLKNPGEKYDTSIDRISGMIKEIVTSALTFQGDNATALQIMELAQESALLKQNAAQWKAFTDKVMDLRKMKFTWSGEAANVYGGANIAIGRHNAILPGMELSELGNKGERAANNLLVSTSKRNASFTRPLKVISKAMDAYSKEVGKVLGLDRRPQQAMRVAFVNEGVQFDPNVVAEEMAKMLEKDSKGLIDPKIVKQYFGGDKNYKKFRDQYAKAGSKENWIKNNVNKAMFQKSLDLEQILVSKGAASSFNSRRENPVKSIDKSLIDSRASAIIAGWDSDSRNKNKKGRKIQISEEYARILAARELTHLKHLSLTQGEGDFEDKYLISSYENRRGQTGAKAMFGSSIHGTMDVVDDFIMAFYLKSLGFSDADIFDSHGNYRVGAIATNKANARTLGGNTNKIINRLTSMMYDEATHDNGNYIKDKNIISARAKQLSKDFAKQVGEEAKKLTGGKVSKKFATSLFGDFFTFNGDKFVTDNIQTVVDKAISDGKLSADMKANVIKAFEYGMVNTMQGMYNNNGARMTKQFGTMPVKIENGNIVTTNSVGMIAEEIFGQPDIALYGEPYSKGGRPASFGYKNMSNLLRGTHLASAKDKNADVEVMKNVYGGLFREGLRHSPDKLTSAQLGVDRLIGDSFLDKQFIRQHKGEYAVFTDKDIYGDNDDYFDKLKALKQEVVEGDLANGKRGYKADAFEKSIFYKIMQAQKSGKRTLWDYGWAGVETDPFGTTTALQGDYVGLGNLDFEKVKGANGEEYYIPADTAEGMMSLINVQYMSALMHGKNQAQRDMRIAADAEDRNFAELRLNALPAEYLAELQDMVYEKNSSIVEGATKAQLRHSMGGTLLAAPTSGHYFDVLNGGARGIISRKAMKSILSRIDEKEDEASHNKAIERIAKELGVQIGPDTAGTIDNILNKIDVDSPTFDVKAAKGLLGLGMRYPLLTDLNMPGIEWFVSSQHDMNKNSGMDTQTMMLNRSIMDMLNADVDGDKAYMIMSMADASVGNLSDTEYKKLLKSHKALQEYGNRIAKKIDGYYQGHGIQRSEKKGNEFIKGTDIESHNLDINTQLISNLAGEATKKNFADVGKYDNLRQMIQNFEEQRSGGIWALNNKGLGKGAGQISEEDLFTSLVAAEFATIFPQEGISAKKVYEKLSKNGNFNWGEAKTEEERRQLIENAFRGTYEKLKDASTFSEPGLKKLGEELAGWGLISTTKGTTAASDKRAATLLAIMAEATGNDKWLSKTLDWETISNEILKYQNQISGKDILLANGERIHLNSLADLFKYDKNKLLPYSRLASYKTLGGSGAAWSRLSEEQQQKFLKKFSSNNQQFFRDRFNLGNTFNYYGMAGMPQSFDAAKYEAIYRNMAGMYGGKQDDLVAAALAQYEATGTLPYAVIASGLGKFLYQAKEGGDATAEKELASSIEYLNRVGSLTPEKIATMSLDEKATLASIYKDTGMNNLFRGNFMNIAQILGRYGRNKKGEINSFEAIQKAYETGDYSGLGLSKANEKALKEEWGKRALSIGEFRNMASLNLGGKDYSNASIDDIVKDARSFINSSSASQDQVLKAHDIINMSHLMSSGGGPAQLFGLLNNFAALTDNPEAVSDFLNMTNTAANILKGYTVVGTEQNLAGFVNNGAAANGNQKIAGIRGSADLVLKKAGGGVRIADFKSVNFAPSAASDQYIAQLMAYGYAYNQMRDKIRSNPNQSYKDFKNSKENQLYERMMGQTLDKQMFDLMASEEGGLEDLALHYVTKNGSVRTFNANYSQLMNSPAGKAVMGAMLNKALNDDGNINYDILTSSSEWASVKQRGFKSNLAENEYVEPYKQKSKKEQVAEYEKNAKEIARLQSAIIKQMDLMVRSGTEIDEKGTDAGNKYLKVLREEIEALRDKQAALTKVDEKTKELYDKDSLQVEAEKNAAEQIEKRKENITSFNQALQSYSKYQQEYWKLEAQTAKAKPGTQKEILEQEKELVHGYVEEAKQAMDITYGNMNDKEKQGVASQIEKANKQLELTKLKMEAMGGAGDGRGVFGKLADGIKMSMQRMFSFGMIGYKIVGKISQAFQKVIGYAQQLDQAMVNIQIVTGKTRDEAFDLMDSYNKLARQLGSTTTEVANSANVWLRQGYSVNKVNELITSSLYLSKLGMLDTATAAKDLTGIIKGFKLEVSEATNVVSKLTMIDQNAAVSAGNIATAMQQVSASAQQAGLSIDTTMGYISTIADVSQRDPSSVGASLRTIISRYGTVKAGAFSGMGVDNTGDDLENINDIEKVLRRLGISIRTSTMEFRALDEVLGEIADKWMEYSSVERNAIATAFAGTRQRESFLILMSNMDKARELTKVAAESQGMAELKYQAYMESSEAATKRLQNAWEGLTNSFKTSNFLAGVKNTIAWLVENLDKIAITIGNIFLTAKTMHGVGVFQKMGASGAFGKFFGSKKDFFTKATNYMTGNEWTSYLPTYSNYLKDLVRMVGTISGQKPQSVPASATGTAAGAATSSGGGTVTTNTVPFYVTSSGKTAYRGEDGTWYYVNQGNKLGKQKVGKTYIDDLNTKEANAAQAAADAAEKERQAKILRRGGPLGQRVARGAAAGAAAGLMQGISTGKFLKDSDGESASTEAKVAAGLTTGLATGVATGLLSAIPVAGPLLGSTFGPLIGQLLNNTLAPWMASIIDQEAISRRERSKEAEKSYSAIKAIENDTNTLKELSTEGALSYDQYQKAQTAVNNMITQLYGNTEAGRILLGQYNPGLDISKLSDIEVIDKIKLLFNDYLLGDERIRQQMVNNWEQALYQAEADTFRASKENEFYNNREVSLKNYVGHAYGGGVKSIIDEFVENNLESFEENARRNNKLYFTGTASERLTTQRRLLEYLEDQGKEGTTFYKKLQKSIAELNNAVHNIDESVYDINEKQVKASAIRTGISNLNSAQIKELGIDEIARMILKDINEQGGFYEENGNVQRRYQWTGSLDSLAKIPKDYISNYIKNDATLYGILSGQSYTLGEVSRGALSGQKAADYKLSFAKQLNMTVEELNANLEKYSSFSLGDIMKGYSDVKASLESLDSLFGSIVSSTGLTADNFTEILSKYPEFIGQVGDIGSLVASIFNKTEVYIEEQRRNLIEDLGSNEGFFNNWKLSLSEGMRDLMKGTALENVKSGASFWDAYMTLTEADKEKFSEIAESFKKEFNSVTAEVSIDTTILDKYRSYLSKIYEMQIKNLQEQKTALEKVNSQREYENKLVQARLKLENAQNEKTQVYREGIGFVYEADQEAIRQAQEELDKLDNEKVIDSLDVIIAEMQSQKDWLDQMPDRQEFSNLESAFGQNSPFAKILGDGTNTSGIWGSVNKLVELYEKTYNLSAEGFTSSRENIWNMGKEEATEFLQQSYSDYDAYSRIKQGFSQYFLGNIDNEGLRKILEDESTNTKNSDTIKMYASNLMNDLEKENYSSTTILQGAYNTQGQVQASLEAANSAATKLKNDYKVSNWYTELFTGENIDILNKKNAILEGKDDYLRQYAYNEIAAYVLGQFNSGNLSKWKDVQNTIKEYANAHGELNINYQVLNDVLDSTKLGYGNIYNPLLAERKDKENAIKDFLLKYILNNPSIISEGDNLSGSAADSYALGSLYARGGLSSISELGPELFTTPGLSGTALIPEGSKVIPAEATRGLWEFGNFAADFIKPLKSLGGLGSSSSTVFGADESTNINTLNITLRADKDFDADKFIQQLKALQAISKNN